MIKLGCVHLVGAGPGDPDLLTVKAWSLITRAGTVVFDRLVGAAVLDLIPAIARRFDVGKQTGRHSLPQDAINSLLVDLARQGADVVRLKGGDPFIFGRGGEEALHLARHGIPFDIVPGITAASGCAAAFGIPLTHRGLAEGVRLVTGHRQDDRPLDLDWHTLADPGCTLAVYMGVASAAHLADGLMGAGRDAATPVALIENGTTPAQRLRLTTLAHLAADMETWSPQPPALLIVGEVVRLAQRQEPLSRLREREGPTPKAWEGEGAPAEPPSPASLTLGTLSRLAGEGKWAVALLCLLLALPARAAAPDHARQARLAELVAEDCGACHGMTRKGGLGPPLLAASLAGLDDQAVAATILDGRPDTPMPPWRGLLSEDDAGWIARYLKGETDVR